MKALAWSAAAVLAALMLLGCERTGSSPTQTALPSETAEETATPPPPQGFQAETITRSLEPIGEVKLPVEDGRLCMPMEALPSNTLFVSCRARIRSAEDLKSIVTSLGFFNVETGALEELGSLKPGWQVLYHDNDGQFLVWTEVPIVDMSHAGWQMFALDLSSHEKWLVDSDAVSQHNFGDRPYDPDLAVDSGRLAYFHLVPVESGEPVSELKMVDLKTRESTVLLRLEGDVSSKGTIGISLSRDSLIWIEYSHLPGPDGLLPGELRLMDLSSGDLSVLAQGSSMGAWPAIGQGKVLHGVGRDEVALYLMNLSTGEDKLIWGPYLEQGSLSIAPGYALWTDHSTRLAVAYDLMTGELIRIGGPDAQGVFVSGQRVYWEWRPEDAPDDSDEYYVSWADLPPP